MAYINIGFRDYHDLLNVGSTGSFAPAPLMSTYGAVKAFVLSFSEGLSEELKGTAVRVTALCPGVTLTGFQETAKVNRMRLVRGLAISSELYFSTNSTLTVAPTAICPGAMASSLWLRSPEAELGAFCTTFCDIAPPP
jgi:short-subunit dehydrogenase